VSSAIRRATRAELDGRRQALGDDLADRPAMEEESPKSPAEDVKFTFDRLTKEGAMGGGQTSPRQSLLGAPRRDTKRVPGH
jgi:hypothetical protein